MIGAFVIFHFAPAIIRDDSIRAVVDQLLQLRAIRLRAHGGDLLLHFGGSGNSEPHVPCVVLRKIREVTRPLRFHF